MATPRLGTKANQDNTFRQATYYYEEPAYAATLALTTKDVYLNEYHPSQLTGAITINVTDTDAVVGDQLVFLFNSDSTNRVVTFGTNLAASGALTVTASKKATARFIHDGTEFVELSRTVTA